ncbi:MAG: hypothetical protein K2M15_01890 [Oscillospiraceae bacterium]|nr:hypothetical protein [Oscillospiraceae bacterium]MDE7171894.1 hypothetical protein [Oscillospiraceae bacterium]
MDARINEGYIITDSIHVGETEFVFGKLDSNIPMYVTWACKGGDNYYWGHYFSDPLDAKKDLLDRAGEELEFQKEREARAAEKPPKEQDKECER